MLSYSGDSLRSNCIGDLLPRANYNFAVKILLQSCGTVKDLVALFNHVALSLAGNLTPDNGAIKSEMRMKEH